MPMLSVIIASYNHQNYIAETLASLEGQTFQDFEIILVDDGSSDKTVEKAKGANSRAQVYTQENQGVVAARNRGIELSKGKYICFVDSDDIVLPERFARQIKAFEQHQELGLAYADALIIDTVGKEIGRLSDVYPVRNGDTAEMLMLHYCFIPMITAMVRADVLKRTGPFEKPGPISDYIKWIEVAHLSRVYYDKEPLGCWRRHKTSISKNANKVKSYAKTRTALKKILRKYPDLAESLGNRMQKRFAGSYFLSGFFLAADGDVARAHKYYCKAVKIYPYSFKSWAAVILTALPAKNFIIKMHQYVKAKKLPW